MPNHYVYLNPGDNIYVLTNREAGAKNMTTVVELVFATEEHDGELYFRPAKRQCDAKQSVFAYRHEMLDSGQEDNLSCMTLPGGKDDTLDHAYAISNEKRMKTGQLPWVSTPVKG